MSYQIGDSSTFEERKAMVEEGYKAGLAGLQQSECEKKLFPNNISVHLASYFRSGYLRGLVRRTELKLEEDEKKMKREMSKLTGKTFVRVSLDDASVIEGMLFDLKNERCLSTHELFAFQNFLKAYEDAKKREKKKQDLADEMGEGTWSLK
jgi:hypothetical protein